MEEERCSSHKGSITPTPNEAETEAPGQVGVPAGGGRQLSASAGGYQRSADREVVRPRPGQWRYVAVVTAAYSTL